MLHESAAPSSAGTNEILDSEMLDLLVDLPIEDAPPLSFGDLWDRRLDDRTFAISQDVDYFQEAMDSLRNGIETISFGPAREDELGVEIDDGVPETEEMGDFGFELPGA